MLKHRKFKHPFLSDQFHSKYKNRIELNPDVPTQGDVNDRSYFAETYYPLPQLLRFEDKNSMRWSIESRLPFCDYEFVEMMISTHPSQKLHKGITKKIFRDALKDNVPQVIMERKDKIGFEIPDDKLLRSDRGKIFVSELFESKRFKERTFWDYEKVKERWNEHLSGINNGRLLWKIIILELWYRKWIEGS
nr:asparagine synthase-related protein [Methanobacterium formicicum]